MKRRNKQEMVTEETTKKSLKEGLKSMFVKTVRVVAEDEDGNEIIVDKEKLDVKKVGLAVGGTFVALFAAMAAIGATKSDDEPIEEDSYEVNEEPDPELVALEELEKEAEE